MINYATNKNFTQPSGGKFPLMNKELKIKDRSVHDNIYQYCTTHMLLYLFLRSTTELSGKWSETLGTDTL